jgi:hypothetical protein
VVVIIAVEEEVEDMIEEEMIIIVVDNQEIVHVNVVVMVEVIVDMMLHQEVMMIEIADLTSEHYCIISRFVVYLFFSRVVTIIVMIVLHHKIIEEDHVPVITIVALHHKTIIKADLVLVKIIVVHQLITIVEEEDVVITIMVITDVVHGKEMETITMRMIEEVLQEIIIVDLHQEEDIMMMDIIAVNIALCCCLLDVPLMHMLASFLLVVWKLKYACFWKLGSYFGSKSLLNANYFFI